jgi:hypothetical protein
VAKAGNLARSGFFVADRAIRAWGNRISEFSELIHKFAVDEDMEWIKPLCDRWFERFYWIFWISPDG